MNHTKLILRIMSFLITKQSLLCLDLYPLSYHTNFLMVTIFYIIKYVCMFSYSLLLWYSMYSAYVCSFFLLFLSLLLGFSYIHSSYNYIYLVRHVLDGVHKLLLSQFCVCFFSLLVRFNNKKTQLKKKSYFL